MYVWSFLLVSSFAADFRRLSSVVERLYERAHEYANLASRASAIATDVALASEEFRMPPDAMRAFGAKKRPSTSISIRCVFYLRILYFQKPTQI